MGEDLGGRLGRRRGPRATAPSAPRSRCARCPKPTGRSRPRAARSPPPGGSAPGRRPSASSCSSGSRPGPGGLGRRVGVDLGDHQRDVLVHAEEGGVVDDDRAGLDDLRGPLGADRAARRGEHQVEALDRLVESSTRTSTSSPREANALAGRAGRGERDQLRHREVALGKDLEDRRADGAGRAKDADAVGQITHLALCPKYGLLSLAPRSRRHLRPVLGAGRILLADGVRRPARRPRVARAPHRARARRRSRTRS